MVSKLNEENLSKLSVVAIFSEESAYTVLSHVKDDVEIQGLLIIKKAYVQHRDNAEVVETICSLLLELAEYGNLMNFRS